MALVNVTNVTLQCDICGTLYHKSFKEIRHLKSSLSNAWNTWEVHWDAQADVPKLTLCTFCKLKQNIART